ncbi:hypothetical protein DH2020_019375 [Rehmannia glutinosa]|uniref:Uncharacterized protein n=1 Tax=Rehmannia glutinosa TaxID=99300 RepID=A0ABR0WLN1_REHGL
MDAQEKLTALKKAYADIILNISKEAATRVMSSERRAARYQHELKVEKEEALRMLMRLKQMMDSKICQTEAASMNQQKKIEELEAQLQEAEDIVKDLREELGEAQTELERLKKDNLQHLNELNNACSRETDNTIYSYHSKESVGQGVVSLRETEKVNDEQNSRDQEESEDTSGAPAFGEKTPSELDNKLLEDIKLSKFQSFPQKRKRANRVRKIVTPLSGMQTDFSRSSVSVKDSSHSSENHSKTAPMCRNVDPVKAEMWSHLGCAESSGKETNLLETSNGRIMQNDKGLKEKRVPLGDETGVAESFSSPDCEVDVEKVDATSNGLEPNSSYTTKGLHSQSVRERVIKYTFQRKRKREASSGSVVNATLETEKKTGDKQNGDQNTGDKQNGDQNIGDKQNGPQNLEQSKTSLLKESSRESRRLAQVARQDFETKWQTSCATEREPLEMADRLKKLLVFYPLFKNKDHYPSSLSSAFSTGIQFTLISGNQT